MTVTADPAREAEAVGVLGRLNDGFLGTGLSTGSELAFLALAGIVGYVIFAFARYFLAGSEVPGVLAMLFGLRDD